MSEDSNQPTPPPSPEERPAQPHAESFDGGPQDESWLLDVGPEPGAEYAGHEAVDALPSEWEEGPEPSGEWTEPAPAEPAFAEGFDVFEEEYATEAVHEGYEEFGEAAEASFIEPAAPSRPVFEALLPGVVAMFLSFAGIAVWSFVRTPETFNGEVEVARSDRDFDLFGDDDTVELAPPLTHPAEAPGDDRVVGYLDIGQGAGDLSEPDELGYASDFGDAQGEHELMASAAIEPGPVTVVQEPAFDVMESAPSVEPTAVEPGTGEPIAVEIAAAEDDAAEGIAADDTVADSADSDETFAEQTVSEEQVAESVAVESTAVEGATAPSADVEPGEVTVAETTVAEDTAAEDTAAEDTAAEDTAAEVATIEGPDPQAGTVEGEGQIDGAETPSVADGATPADTSSEGDVALEEPVEDTASEDAATRSIAEVFGDSEGWNVVAIEYVGDVDPLPEGVELVESAPAVEPTPEENPVMDPVAAVEDVASAVAPTPSGASEAPFAGPGAEAAPMEPFSDRGDAVAEVVAPELEPWVDQPEVADADDPATDTFVSDWMSALVGPAIEVVEEAPAPEVVARAPLTEEAVEAVVEETVAAEPFDWSRRVWDDNRYSTAPEFAAPDFTEQQATGTVEVAEAAEPSGGEFIADAAGETPAVEEEAPSAGPVIVQIEVFDGAFADVEEPFTEPVEVPDVEEPAAEPTLEVAEAAPEAADETSSEGTPEAGEVTFVGWPAEWSNPWHQVAEYPAPELVEGPAADASAEETFAESTAAEASPAENDVAQDIPAEDTTADVTLSQPAVAEAAPIEPDGFENEAPEVSAAEVESTPASELGDGAIAAEAEPTVATIAPFEESVTVESPAAEVAQAAAAEENATEETAVEDAATEDAVAEGESADAGDTVAAETGTDGTSPEEAGSDQTVADANPADADNGDDAVASAEEPAEDPALDAVAAGPALPEFAPILTPPSPELLVGTVGSTAGPASPDAAPAAPGGDDTVASMPAAPGAVESELEEVPSSRTVRQKEVEVEVVQRIAEETPTRRRRQVLQRVEDDRYWRFKSVPRRKFDAENMVYTPNVGNVRVVLKGGEAIDGRLHSVGQHKIMLDTEMGRMAVDSRRAERVDRLNDGQPNLRAPSKTASTSGLKRVKVRAKGGVFYGYLVSRKGDRVTLLMDEGFKITLQSNDVTETSDKRGPRLRRVGGR